MQEKYIQPIQAICFETKTSLQALNEYVRVVARRLYRYAFQQDLEVTGPIYWIYQGADGNPETIFSLTIALPVSTFPDMDSEFVCRTLEAFRCLSTEHEGNWAALGSTYGQLFGEIQKRGLTPSGINREIYLNMDFENLEANTTVVQIGLLP